MSFIGNLRRNSSSSNSNAESVLYASERKKDRGIL